MIPKSVENIEITVMTVMQKSERTLQTTTVEWKHIECNDGCQKESRNLIQFLNPKDKFGFFGEFGNKPP